MHALIDLAEFVEAEARPAADRQHLSVAAWQRSAFLEFLRAGSPRMPRYLLLLNIAQLVQTPVEVLIRQYYPSQQLNACIAIEAAKYTVLYSSALRV